jgi:hypothetical protein
MKIKAELIQGSNNTISNTPIYTFKLTYPKENAVLDFIGLSKYFEKWLRVERTVTADSTAHILIEALMDASTSTCTELMDQIASTIAFTQTVFKAVGNGGRLSGADIQHAINLFGPRLQEVLKQYRPGEVHRPTGNDAHWRVATETGWEEYDWRAFGSW